MGMRARRCLPQFGCCFFSSRRRHTRLQGDWSSDVCSSDLEAEVRQEPREPLVEALPALRVDGDERRPGVRPQVVHAHDGKPEGARGGLRGGGAQGEAGGETRPAGDGDPGYLFPVAARSRPLEERAKVSQVLPGRDVGDDAAMLRVELDLAVDPFAGDARTRVEDRQGRLVAGALEREDHLSPRRAARRTSIAASSCLSSTGANPNRSLKSAGSVISGRKVCRSSFTSSSGLMTTSTWGEIPRALILTPLGVK